jgi:hypothetical protein
MTYCFAHLIGLLMGHALQAAFCEQQGCGEITCPLATGVTQASVAAELYRRTNQRFDLASISRGGARVFVSANYYIGSAGREANCEMGAGLQSTDT